MTTVTGRPTHHRGWLARRHSTRVDEQLAAELADLWRQVAEGAGIGRSGASDAGIPFVAVPRVEHVDLGAPDAALTVRLMPGQLVTDIARVSRRLAAGMGYPAVRVQPLTGGRARIVLLSSDPLADTIGAVRPVESALSPLVLGRGEDGRSVTLELATAAHIVIQGATGSGKSVGLYSLLGQLATAPDVRVTGVDPTGLLLGPWARRMLPMGNIPGPVCGTADPGRYVLALDRLVAEMDRRIADLPAGADEVVLGDGCPVLLVVLEEHPGALRILDGHDAKLGKLYRALVGRLLAEGRKAGLRCVLVAQRADAAIVGAYERGQASHRISFRVDSLDAVRMLHPDGTADVVAEHATAPAGVALLTAPGVPLTRLRAPWLPYRDYCDQVAGVDLRSTLSRDQHRALGVVA